MITFVVIAAVLVAVAFAWLLPPLLRGRVRGAALDREQENLRLLREQRVELETDLARGTISPEQHAESKAEIERRVLEETQAQARSAASPPPGGRLVAIAVAVTLPLAAAALYAMLGDPGAIGLRLQVATEAPTAGHSKNPSSQEIEAMVSQLKQRLDKDPGNAEGWFMLARSYFFMRRYGEAVDAYENLVKLVPDDADVLADYADALAMRNGRNIVGKPFELVQQALKVDPNHVKALAMAGTEAFDRKDFKGAVDYWERLRAVAPPDSEIARNIDGSIAEARSRGGLAPAPAKLPSAAMAQAPVPPAAKSPPAAMAQAPAPQGKEAPQPTAAGATAAGATVHGMVRLDPALAARVAPTDTVFVFARAQQGPRVPLAVLRLQVKDLPAKFALDDSLAMAPQFRLSGFKSVLVNARVSKSGNATPSSGDLEGQSIAVDLGARDVAVIIDRIVP